MNTLPPCGDIEAAVHTYGSMLYRLSLAMLHNTAEAEDAVQETFFKYVQRQRNFSGAEHEKAWLIRVCINKCRDVQRSKKRYSPAEPGIQESDAEIPDETGILDALAQVPEKFRMVLTLHYVEGYPVGDIAKIIRLTPSAVKMRLQKGRKLLEEIYRKEYM